MRRTDPAAICFRLTASQMSVIWTGLDLIVKAHAVRQQDERVLYAYPFSLYPPPAGFDRGTFDIDMMGRVTALWNTLRSKATVGGRVQMNCIQIRAAIFAVRTNLGRWRRRRYDERLRDSAKRSAGVSPERLRKLKVKSERVVRSLERHMKRANRLLQSLVSREDYAAFMDAWKKHLRWMRLRLVYFKPLLPVIQGREYWFQLEMADHGIRSKGFQPPSAQELRRMMRLYVQYARRGREYNFPPQSLLKNEKSVYSTNHLANFVLRRLSLETLPEL